MKKEKYTLLMLVIMAIGIITGCKKDEKDEDPPQCNIVFITDDITSNTTFSEGNVYIIDINGDWNIEATLVIEPGVVVKSLKSYQPYRVVDNGKVLANGTDEKPIVFTSQFDNAHGCDNTGDGTPPKAGDWGQFLFLDVTGSELNHCHFYYGGGLLLATVEVNNSTVKITDCVFAYNKGGDHFGYSGALDLNKANEDCVVKNNIFYSNILPMSIKANLSIDNSNSFSKPGDNSIINQMNGIFTNDYFIDKHVSWTETEVAFVIGNGSSLRIDDNSSLSLGVDVVLKVVEGSAIDLINTEGKINNHNGVGVYFTSIRDDSKKGDTNGDGNETFPVDGDWDGVIIDHAPIEYAKWDNILYAGGM